MREKRTLKGDMAHTSHMTRPMCVPEPVAERNKPTGSSPDMLIGYGRTLPWIRWRDLRPDKLTCKQPDARRSLPVGGQLV